ncbi:MAG: Gfo/Idh/MocA family protein [Anaerolineae bacterium]|jgi:predicted dehydrogenase|nr:Gfo/Idh/MocA family oxidoreductase [Chloroflexota bacterium]
MGISVGLVGLGQFGRQFVQLYGQHPEVDCLALCDVDPLRLATAAREHGITECYASLDALCRSDIDAVVLITQPWLHWEQAMQALEAGKHVYSAVPAVYGNEGDVLLERCDQLVQAVRRSGTVYMLGETTLYRRETEYCRQRALAGGFGALTYGECEYWHDMNSPSANLYEVYRNRWGANWGPDKRGCIPMHYPTHATSSMVEIMGAHMTSVSALGYEKPDEDWFIPGTLWNNRFGNEVALYRMSNGAIVRHAELRRVGHPERESFRLFGTKASFVSDPSGVRWTDRSGWKELELDEPREALPAALASNLGGHGGSHAYLVHAFVRACITGRHPRANVWQAMRYLAPGIVAHQSALRDGEVLPVPDWGDAPEGR